MVKSPGPGNSVKRLSSQELLRSYRVAHARVQTIDTFEASLRESTPLTSISDPRALVEYLNQLNLKSDMVVDELKRVSHDRDMYKQQLGDAEKQARDAWDEVANLREANGTAGKADHKPHLETETSSTQVSLTEQSKTDYSPSSVTKSPPTSAKSPTGSLTSLSIFSPKSKPVESPIVKNTPEDLFSYDDEVPRLQAEVKDRDERIGKLQGEVINLKGDLAVTRESTQSMVQTLEEATRELNNLRDHKDRSSAEIAEERETSKKLSDKLQADVKATEAKLRDVEVRHRSDNIERLDELKQQLNQANDELQILREKARTSDEKTSEVQSLQRRVIFLENEISETRAAKELSEKKADTASSLLKTVRDELAENERKYTDIVSSKETLKETLQERIRYLENPEKQQGSHNAGTGLKDKIEPSTNVSQALNQTPENVSRKKNKKKKKGGKPVGEQTTEPQLTASEPVPTQTLEAGQDFAGKDENLRKLRDEIDQCRQQLEEKDTALEKMRSKLKDQDDLKEEIEGLRDNLIDVGQEHVQAKEKVKELQAEKRALQDTVASLERELVRLQGLQASNTASADQRQQDLSIQFEELKTKATALQTNLSAAEQLASSRFKELSELKAVIQEAQPELTSLRSEVKDLKSIKESHDKKEAELKRIEARQQDMYTEIAMQKRIVAERDAEVRGVNQKLAQENSSRSQAEDARSKANEEIQRLETEKRQAAESLDKLSKDLSGARDEITNLRGRTKELEQQIIELKRSNEGLKDEIELKTAQHASAQSLMSSMRDQTTEMAVQVKEARERCESLDEEVADAHRLLSERSREGETMRRLLSDIEGKTEARTREMKERMENAIEERDRAEDEASTAARRRARELDDLRNKVREAERSLKRAEDDKEELETAQRDWKRRREELEHRSEQSVREAEEVRRAMGELRDALDGSEQQAREAEKQKAELRRGLENTQHRLERLQKSNKVRPPESMIEWPLLILHA